jgi:hypothetical protein
MRESLFSPFKYWVVKVRVRPLSFLMEDEMPRRAMLGTLLSLALILALGNQHLFAQMPAAPSDTLIRLKSVTFDPGAGEPVLAHALRSAPESGPGTYLLQFGGPVQEAWKTAAAQAGVTLYGYIPDHAFIARMDAGAVDQVRALPFVRWVGPYHPAYRLDPTIASAQTAGGLTVEAQTLPEADLDALGQVIAGWGGVVEGQAASPIAGYLRARLPAARLSDLAARDEVLWVGRYSPPQLFNNIGGGQIMRANEVRQSLGLFGAGQIVAVADTGLDLGNPSTIHPDFQNRVVKGYCLGRPSPCDWSDQNGHGTHVAGSVLGSGKASGSDPAAHQYPATSFAGVAPEARLVMQSIEDAGGSLGGIPDDTGDLMRQTYADGARIHTNSWGGPTGGSSQFPQYGGYVADSQQVDLAAWEHKDMLILFAAGNQGGDANGNGVVDPDSIGQPGTAKNVITVGASENQRPTDNGNCTWGACFSGFGANPIADDLVSDDANGMAAFSSRGPTDDGRIKPELVAPGTNIVSALSKHPSAGTGWGAHSNPNYAFQGGTSMATPLTAGAAAVVREWLIRDKGIPTPSAALMKSVLINGAADMSPGQYGTGSSLEIPSRRPNNVTGWGRVDLREALDPPAPRSIWLVDNTAGTATGGTATYSLDISATQAQAAATHEPRSVARLSQSSAGPLSGSGEVSPQASAQLVQNGGFENSTLAPWDTLGSPALDPAVKHGGAQSVRLGGYNGADDEVQQTLSIPANATDVTIDFWYKLDTVEVLAGFDEFCYGLWDVAFQTEYAKNCGDFALLGNQDWTHEVYSLTAGQRANVAGKSVVLVLYVTTDIVDPSQAWFDDVALNVTAPDGGTTPSPTATTPPAQSGDPLRVTLAWTDYPGEPSAAKALVNDLDLEVIGPDGTHYTGNQGLYSSGQCLRDGKWDACNNVEGIIIPRAPAGRYTIVVHGAQVAQGGRQPFALVASGNDLQQVGSSLQKAVFVPLALRAGSNLQALGGAPTPAALPAAATPVAATRQETR